MLFFYTIKRIRLEVPKGMVGFVKYKSRSRYAEGKVEDATCQGHNTDVINNIVLVHFF
jgi:hypothetical protein